jgi:cytochrome c peroxidase
MANCTREWFALTNQRKEIMKMKLWGVVFGLLAVQAVAGEPALPGGKWVTPKVKLGGELFFDTNLSTPAGQSCASCHEARRAFTDPDKRIPTSEGVISERFGSRNTPTAMYAAFSPEFHFDEEEGLFVGGQFWDGRAANLEEQAKQPFLNPLEMANPSRAAVVKKVRRAPYARLFEEVYGQGALDETERAYDLIADAIAAFERSPALNRFSSKYDAYLAGKARLSPKELRGLKVFEDPAKGNCAACHPNRPSEDGSPPLFTDFTYDNLGVPGNPDNPFYALPSKFNPNGRAFVDRGLGASVGSADEDGKFKVSTLRNIAVTAPYMHNGYFRSLRAVVEFYNNRDVKPACRHAMTRERAALRQGCWPVPEVADNVNQDELGNLGLTDREMDDLVAFLNTLTDGYRPFSRNRETSPKWRNLATGHQ